MRPEPDRGSGGLKLNGRLSRACLLFVVAGGLCVSLASESLAWDSLTLGGYYKSFFTILDSPDTDMVELPVMGAVSNRLRCTLAYEPADWLAAHVAYDGVLQVQDPSLFGEVLGFAPSDPARYRVTDLDSRVYPSEGDRIGSFGVAQNLDRAFVTFILPWADVSFGRQPIAWGNAHAINPTDILAPFTFDALDTEDRTGVDAARVQIPMGSLGELDLGAVFGEDLVWEDGALFLRGKWYVAQTDVSALLLEFREHLLVGLDLTRTLGGATGWVEAARIFDNAFGDEMNHAEEDYFRGSIGLDYGFSGSTYAFVEYHWSQAGSTRPEEFLTQLTKPSVADGAVYLMGKHYLAPGLTVQVTPLISVGVQVLWNLTDPSVLLAPQLEYNIAEDIYLAAGGFLGLGKRPEVSTLAAPLRSEFGSYPDVYFTSFRIYF